MSRREPGEYPWYFSLILLSVTGMLCFAIGECSLRILRPPAQGFGTVRNFVIIEKSNLGLFDASLGWVLRPNVQDHDERGYRKNGNDSIVYKGPGTILTIGDSYTYGAEVETRDTWPSELERLLMLRVVNGGVGGYGLAQMLTRTERTLEWVQPQTVVVAPISPDLFRSKLKVRHGYGQSYFKLNDSGGLDLVPAEDLSGYRPDLFKRTFGYSHMVHLFMRKLFKTYWHAGSEYDFQEADIDNVAVSRLIVERFVDLVVNRGDMDLLFVGLPADIADDKMVVLYEDDYEREVFEVAEHIHAAVKKHDRVQYLDVQTGMKTAFPDERERAKLFHSGPNSAGHFNPHGTRFVARAIARKIDRNGRLNDATPDYRAIGRAVMNQPEDR